MEQGEPPGRELSAAEQSDGQQSLKPVRISVQLDFKEADTGIISRGHKGMLQRPLADMFDNATIQLIEQSEGERPLRKTIGVFQGLTNTRVKGHMRYQGSVSVSPDKLDIVHANIHRGLELMTTQFKGGLENVLVRVNPPLETFVTSVDSATVELNHEAPARDGQQGEDDRNGVGSPAAEA